MNDTEDIGNIEEVKNLRAVTFNPISEEHPVLESEQTTRPHNRQ